MREVDVNSNTGYTEIVSTQITNAIVNFPIPFNKVSKGLPN